MAKKTIIQLVLSSLILIFSSLTWCFIFAAFWHNNPDYLQRILTPLISFLILGVLAGLWFLIENRRLILWLAPALIFLPFLIIFSFFGAKLTSYWNLVLFLVLFFIVLFFGLGIRASRETKESRLKIELIPILQSALKPSVTAMIILASISFYFSPSARLNVKEIFIPRPFFDSLFSPLINILEKSLPKNGLTNGANVKNQNLPQEITNQLTAQEKNLSDQTYGMLNQIITNAGKPFKKYIPLGLTLSFFFALKIFELIFLWVMIFGIWVLWKVLRFFNILKIKIIKVDKEVIEL